MKRDPSLVRLSRDHHRGLVWAMRIERELPTATDDAIAAMSAELVAFWQTGLLPHFRAECECLLARLARHALVHGAPGADVIAQTQGDHLILNMLMTTIREDPDPSVRRETMKQFGDLLRRHIRWEEAVLFQATQEHLAGDELAALGADIADRIPEMPPPVSWHGGD
jgi:hypothetical protein